MTIQEWGEIFDKYIQDNYPELIGYYDSNKVVFVPNGTGYYVSIYEYNELYETPEQYNKAKNILFNYAKSNPL